MFCVGLEALLKECEGGGRAFCGGRLRTEMSSFLLCLGEQRKQIGFAEGDLKCGDVVCGEGIACKSPAGQSSGVFLMFGHTGSPDSGPGHSKHDVLSSGL